MLNFTKKDKYSNLKKGIDEKLRDLSKNATTPDQVEELMELLEKRKSLDEKPKISPDTMAVVAGNLLGILLILTYEKANVITSKALGFVLRGRV